MKNKEKRKEKGYVSLYTMKTTSVYTHINYTSIQTHPLHIRHYIWDTLKTQQLLKTSMRLGKWKGPSAHVFR